MPLEQIIGFLTMGCGIMAAIIAAIMLVEFPGQPLAFIGLGAGFGVGIVGTLMAFRIIT